MTASPQHYRAGSAQAQERHPDHLGTRFDWMAVSHRHMYRMVQQGINVQGAYAAVDRWQRMSAELSMLGDDLAALRTELSEAWDGSAARCATENVDELSSWARHTATKAEAVSECIAMQADVAAHARDAMPPPADALPEGGHSPMPTVADVRPVQSSGAHAFAGGGFGFAEHVLSDQQVFAEATREGHAQAANVMTQFQESSREVHQTVPRFTPPDPAIARRLTGGRGERRSEFGSTASGRRHADDYGTAGTTMAAAVVAGGAAAASGVGGAASPGGAGGIGGVGGVGGIGGGPGEGAPGLLAGPRAGARRAGGEQARVVPRATTGAPPPTAANGTGPMPFGAAPGSRDGDQVYRQPSYLDDDLWSDMQDGLRVCLPVIGTGPNE